jgi:RNA polymerase sigma-70 factor (sigma-E family)
MIERARLSQPERLPVGREPADSAVARLYGTHRLAMVRLAALLVDDVETAEDVAQDAFAALHRAWPTLDSQDAGLAYLRTCVVNGSRSVLRRRRTVRRSPRPDEASLTVDSADSGALIADEHRAVLAAIRTLPARQREVIMLRYWSELSEADIAATLGISIGAVKSTASRAREAIARSIGEL